jgi:hypothetical protein
MAGWSDPVATPYNVTSIPKVCIMDQNKASVIGEIPWNTYQGDLGKLKQQLKSAATW